MFFEFVRFFAPKTFTEHYIYGFFYYTDIMRILLYRYKSTTKITNHKWTILRTFLHCHNESSNTNPPKIDTHHATCSLVSSFHSWYILVISIAMFVTHIITEENTYDIQTFHKSLTNFLLTVHNSQFVIPKKILNHFSKRPPSISFLWCDFPKQILLLKHLAIIWSSEKITFDFCFWQM